MDYVINYKTYINTKLKPVLFQGEPTYPLYVQISYKRRTIFFKSYYFELFSKFRFFSNNKSKFRITTEYVIKKENDLISYLVDKYSDEFSLNLIRKAYKYYSLDLLTEFEDEFKMSLFLYHMQKGLPHVGKIIANCDPGIGIYNVIQELSIKFLPGYYDEF